MDNWWARFSLGARSINVDKHQLEFGKQTKDDLLLRDIQWNDQEIS